MPTIDPFKLVPGVRPDQDFLVFWVDSRRPEEPEHRVDLQKYCGNGHCDCEHFMFRMNGKLFRRAIPATQLECWHIRQAKRFYTFVKLNAEIEQRERMSDDNKKKAAKTGPVGSSVSNEARRAESSRRDQKAGAVVGAQGAKTYFPM
jgi:hypothetical protein